MHVPQLTLTPRLVFGLGLLASLIPATVSADVTLPSVFSDHLVLQRGVTVPVWGWASPGEAVAVTVAGQTKTTAADATGSWQVRLDPLSAGEPATLTVSGNNTVTVNDVLIGEVWLASGQSNMQFHVSEANGAGQEKAAAKFPQIRVFDVARHPAVTPQTNCEGRWVICSPETAGSFSAVAYFFGRELHQKLGVPVGLITSSWGGTPIEAWTSMPRQEGRKDFAPVFRQWEEKLKTPYDDAKAQAQYQTQLETWKQNAEKRKAEGKPAGDKPEQPVNPREHKNYIANLFNGMIAPVIPYAIHGVIWYQGENNARGEFAKLYETQLPLMIQDWRERWGQGDFPFAWVQLPNFKKATDDPGAPSDWAVMRESMLHCLSSVPNSGMAVTIDVGDPGNIHPKNKQPVGHRLALWARATVYGEQIPFSGPLPAGATINGAEVSLAFTHTDGGLVAKSGGELKGFVIVGADKKWVRAQARIEGDRVIVTSPAVPAPVAVRYAWADNPDCNLWNGAGLPASPFRTDTW